MTKMNLYASIFFLIKCELLFSSNKMGGDVKIITEIYYHGTKERNIRSIVSSRRLFQKTKEYSQSEDGFVYICHERDFSQTISYSMDSKAISFTFVRFEIVVGSELAINLQYEEKTSDIGTLISYKHKGNIDLDSISIRNPQYIILKKGDMGYDEFLEFITSCPPEYDKAKMVIDKLTWYAI